MNELNDKNFGYLIAYVLPGFVLLLQLGDFSPAIRGWMHASASTAPTIGGFLFATLASIALGLLLSTIRWAVLDSVHRHTGLAAPKLNFGKLQSHSDAWDRLVQYHYRYYQFYGNSLVTLVICAAVPGAIWRWFDLHPVLTSCGITALGLLLFVASRDSLRKYDQRAAAMLAGR
ncbi:MAG: hypothetical protein U0939_22650 [Pirellulales bacterium]